jgi:hypothetical protein
VPDYSQVSYDLLSRNDLFFLLLFTGAGLKGTVILAGIGFLLFFEAFSFVYVFVFIICLPWVLAGFLWAPSPSGSC